MFYCLVFFHMTRFRYFSIGECPQFICFKPVLNSDVNLVKREANLYFLKLVLSQSCLLSFCITLKHYRKTLCFAEEIIRYIDQSAIVKEFAEEFESFVLSTLGKYLYHNVQASTYDPSGLKFCKGDKDNLPVT